MTITDPRGFSSRDRTSNGSYLPFLDLHSNQWVDFGSVADTGTLSFSKKDGRFLIEVIGASTGTNIFTIKFGNVLSGTATVTVLNDPSKDDIDGNATTILDVAGATADGFLGFYVNASREVTLENQLGEAVTVAVMRYG